MTTNDVKQALEKLYQRCLKTAHSPVGADCIKEWHETIRKALEAQTRTNTTTPTNEKVK